MTPAHPDEGRKTNLHSAWSQLFFRGLASAGVTDVVCCPGSRSTPLALAAEGEPGLRVTSVVDERSAAFFALGQARTTGRPTVVIATSGTAGAHFYPAVIEASEAGLPLILLTADRPWELQHAGASQTIDQRKLFGDHVRLALDLGVPERSALSSVQRIAAHAVTASAHPRPGPVHVNAQFRKPLEPVLTAGPEPWAGELESLLERGAPSVVTGSFRAPDEAIHRLSERLRAASRPILVLGPAQQTSVATAPGRLGRAVASIARAYGAAVLAESTSDARYGRELAPHVVASFNTVLAAGAFHESPPDLVIEVSGPPIAGAYEAFVSSVKRPYRVILSDHAFPDPSASADELVVCDACDALERLAALGGSPPKRTSAFATALPALGRRVDEVAAELTREWSEAGALRTLVASMPASSILAVGNSLPIRDLDAFGGGRDDALTVQHQRGAAGIDGLIAGAAGARSVASRDTAVALVLGDVAALHDVGGFALLAEVDAPLVVMVIENGGGRIFEELPLGKSLDARPAFEKLFLTRPPAFIAGTAEAFGVRYARVDTLSALRDVLSKALTTPSATVIECAVPAEDGRERRAKLLEAAREIVKGWAR